MKFQTFKRIYKNNLIIDSQTINLDAKPAFLRRQISEWLKKKWLIIVKKGMYVINEPYYQEKLSPLYIANIIYQPSYISLEYALSHYELIPEKVYPVTSVTTRKTASFRNFFGDFNYHTVKKKLFFGFRQIEVNNQKIFFAEKEKAFLDFCYLNLWRFNENTDDFENFRFQHVEDLNYDVIGNYLEIFKNKKLERIMKLLQKYIKQEKYYSL